MERPNPSKSQVEDAALVARAAGGDDTAFELIVRRHTESVWRMSRSLLPDDFSAEEAVQDTFVKAYRALHSFRAQASVRTWLLAICHRTCLDRLRLKKANVVSLDHLRELRAKETSPDVRLALEQALGTLPEQDRRAFVLVHVLNYSREEAAEICGVPSSTMRTRVARARQRLATAMGGFESAENGG